MEAIYAFTIYNEMLNRRGGVACPETRALGAAILDEEASREPDLILAELSPLLSADLASPRRIG